MLNQSMYPKKNERIYSENQKIRDKKKLKKGKYNYCEMCGRLNITHSHRMVSGDEGGRYTPGNTKQLCLRCHIELHSCGQDYKKIFRLWEKHTTKYMRSRETIRTLLFNVYNTKLVSANDYEKLRDDYLKLTKYCYGLLNSARSCN